MAHKSARGPQEFASPQPALACSRRPLLPVRGPMTKRKRGRILGVGWWGGSASSGPRADDKAQARANSWGGGVGGERFFRVRGPMTKRKRGRILGVGPSKAEFFG